MIRPGKTPGHNNIQQGQETSSQESIGQALYRKQKGTAGFTTTNDEQDRPETTLEKPVPVVTPVTSSYSGPFWQEGPAVTERGEMARIKHTLSYQDQASSNPPPYPRKNDSPFPRPGCIFSKKLSRNQ